MKKVFSILALLLMFLAFYPIDMEAKVAPDCKKECRKSVGDDADDVPPGYPAGSCHTADSTCTCA